MALRDILSFNAEGNDTPVISEMLTELTDIFEDARNGPYDVDLVLATFALSVIRLERSLLERDDEIRQLKIDLMNLEERILNAGLRLQAP